MQFGYFGPYPFLICPLAVRAVGWSSLSEWLAAFRSFFGDGTSWKDALPPRGIRDGALELLHVLVAVEAEVLLAAPGIEGAIMGDLTRHLLDSFTSTVQGQLPAVSRGGILQVRHIVSRCHQHLCRVTSFQLFVR